MKHKSGLIGFSYLAGLICAFFIAASISLILSSVLLITAVIFSLKKKKNIALILFTVSAAMAVCGLYTLICCTPLIELSGTTMTITGTISELRLYSGDTASYIVNTEINGTETKITLFSSDYGCKVGDEITFTARLSELTDNTDFSEKSYYRSKGIFLKAQSVKDFSVNEQKRLFNIKAVLTEYREHISKNIGAYLPNKEGTLLKAVVLGDKGDLSASLSDNIKRCGISHFTAVSGLHLTVIAHILMMFLSLLPISRNRKIKFGFLVALILIFMLFFNMSVSVVRAGIMLIIFYGAEVFMRKGDPISSMGIAILIITIVQPYACIDVGFLLSIAGTAGVSVISPYFCKKLRKTAFYGIKSAMLSTLCATITTFPLSCVFFGGFSAVGVFANLLIYPFFFIALICVILFTLSFGLGTFFLLPAGIMSKAMIFIIDLIGSFKYSYFAFTDDTVSALCILAAAFTALVYLVFRSRRKTVIAFILSVAVLASSVTVLSLDGKGKARLILFSDGDHPCVILENDGERIICAGSDSPDIMEYIRGYMEDRFLNKVNSMIILNENHNYLESFKKIPCDRLILPDDNSEESINSESIAFTKSKDTLIIDIKGISISVSPAKKPADKDINIIYGYKKDFPKLNGMVMFSENRMYGEDYGGINFYYEKSEFYITEKGFLEPLKG